MVRDVIGEERSKSAPELSPGRRNQAIARRTQRWIACQSLSETWPITVTFDGNVMLR
jgi:hypothetical protein